MSATFKTCMDKSQGVTTTMMDCIAAETQRHDKLLNANFQRLLASLDAKRQGQLREVQRLWLAYRQANCAFYADPDGGTIARVSGADCILTATAARAAELGGLMQ